MTTHWMTYLDAAELLWDAVEDDPDDRGAIGSNWQATTREDAQQFVADMTTPEAIADGWRRGHRRAPRH